MSLKSDSEQRAKERRLRIEAHTIYGAVTMRAANGKRRYISNDFPEDMSHDDIMIIAQYAREYLQQPQPPLTVIVSIREIVPFLGKGRVRWQIKCKFELK